MRVVLGPGFGPGLAGIGVLLELEERQVIVDEVIGVNSGALVAALWATGQDLRKLADVLAHLPWEKYLVATSLGEADPLLQTIQLLTQRATFGDVPRKMSVLSRGLGTFTCSKIQDGSIARAVRGSMAVPGIFHPVGPGHENDFMDPGAQWWQFIQSESDDPNNITIWVVPDFLSLATIRPPVSEKEQLAAYVGISWSCIDQLDRSRLIQIDGVGGILSFDQATEWMRVGREATKNWLTGTKGLLR